MRDLVEELKRRSVFKVGAAYLVVSWVLVQVADTIAPMMGLPQAAPSFVLFLLVIFFPIALFLAWAFDIRPTDAEADATSTTKGFIPVGISVVVLGAIAFVALFRSEADPGAEPGESALVRPVAQAGVPALASLAVLPFLDLSPEGDQEYFGDGIAEAILNALAPLDELAVASRTSAFAFKGASRNLGEIAQILDVSYVLEGSVRKAGERVAVTAQLIDATTDRHVWSNTFEHELTVENLIAIQEDIANAIASALSNELSLGLQDRIEFESPTENLDAYDLYLQAQQLSAIASTENTRRQVELAEQAVALDPDFADAWASLAQFLVWLPTWDHTLDAAAYNRRSILAADRALELDPSSPTAFAAKSQAYYKLHEWQRGDDVLATATASGVDVEEDASEIMGLGYLARANEMAVSTARRQPDDAFANLLQGLFEEAMGDSRAAVRQFEQAIMKGYTGGAEWNMAAAYRDLGDTSMWTAIWSRELLAGDPELLPLLPHMRDLLLSPPEQRSSAAARFRSVARELGFEIDDLLRTGPRFGIRIPAEVAVALGRSDVVAEGYWTNYPKMWMWSRSLHDFRQSDAFRSRVRTSGMLQYWQSHRWPDLCRPVGTDDFRCD